MKTKLLLIKAPILVVLFLLALFFEDAASERLAILIVIFTGLLAWSFLRPRFSQLQYLFILDILFILLLEYHSKFVINYFFHSLYIVLLLEAGYLLNRYYGNLVNSLIVVAALGKFFWALSFQINARTISELLFNLFALAFLISLNNYSHLQREEKSTNKLLYQELLTAHQKLKIYTLRAEEAAILEERTRIAREMHDTIGHQQTSIIMQLEVLKVQAEELAHEHQQFYKLQPKLELILETARQSLGETRKAVNALKGTEFDGINGIKELINRFTKTNNVIVAFNSLDIPLAPEESYTLYRLVQESLTNSLRHGRATEISIDILLASQALHFRIWDNGKGADGSILEGFGLKNMRERLENLGGALAVVAYDPFTLEGSFPLRRVRNEIERCGLS
ncbi:MAG: sensor histidine kinase [Bacillota bacterium]|nr:sensor histidine kinase [Bacillota bacterium]